MRRRLVWHAAVALAMTAGALLLASGRASAQTVQFDGPAGTTLPSLTPAFTLRALGFSLARPLRITVQVSTSPDFSGFLALDSTFLSNDTTVAIQVTRLLPDGAQVFWRARVLAPGGPLIDSPVVGPRTVPQWLTLVDPNSVAGDIVASRRPLFVWRSARVTSLLGAWHYDVQITTQGRPEQGVAGTVDTVWRALTDLQANSSYRWNVRAYLDNGTSVLVNSNASFLVKDQPLPLTTLLYQNFPNPFPSPTAFATCIWFDVAEPGARVALDVTDLRGNVVRTLIPGPDGQRDFPPGRYGQGQPGTGSNCDNRFVWDGTGNDGRTVAPGVYLLRFQAGRRPPTFRRMLFLGR